MVLALHTRTTGYNFCHQHDYWTEHPFTQAEEMLLAIRDRAVSLELVGGTFGPRTLSEAWSIQRLVALRESNEQYCRRLVAIEVSAGNGPIIDNALRALLGEMATVVGTFAHLCMARLEIDADIPMNVGWEARNLQRGPRPGVIVLCHQNHRDGRPLNRRHPYFSNTSLEPGNNPALNFQGNFLRGFNAWWATVQNFPLK